MKQKYNPEKQLEYRRPKRVTKIICLTHSGGCFAVCPTCKHLLDREYMGFCDVCGQNLSWRKFDKIEITYK